MEHYNEEERKNLYSELGVTEEILREGSKYLMEWLQKQPHLPNIKDEEYLFNVQVVCKNRLEVVKRLLENLYVARAMMPEIFSNRREFLTQFEDLCGRGFMPIFLPKLTPDGYRVSVYRFEECKPENVPDLTSLVKGLSMIFDIQLKDDQVKGFDAIIDASNFSSSYVSLWIPVVKEFGNHLMRIYKNRAHKFYVVNLTPTFRLVFNSALNLIPKKISKRVLFLGANMEKLLAEIPKNNLPSEYGGDEKSVQDLRNDACEYYKTFFDWLCNEDGVKADLTRMTSENKLNFSEFEFGIDGSFRKVSWE